MVIPESRNEMRAREAKTIFAPYRKKHAHNIKVMNKILQLESWYIFGTRTEEQVIEELERM